MVKKGTVTGKKRAVFEAENGKKIGYGRLYMLYDEDVNDADTEGQSVDTLKLDLDCWDNFVIGMHGTPMFNQYGKCMDIKEDK